MRSAIEIARTLEAMREDADPLTGVVAAGEVLFLSKLLRVELQARFIVTACSGHKPANSAVLAERSVTFHCNHRGTHYEFTAREPREAELAGAPAIQFAFPAALLALQRREHARIPVPSRVPLRCELRLGPLSFDAAVVDVSLGGLGTVVYDASIRIAPGTRIERVRIIHPQREPVLVDLEVRHVARFLDPEGRPANRAGCRIEAAPKDYEDLVRLFVTELGA